MRDNVLVGAHTRLRAAARPTPVMGPAAGVALALVRPATVSARGSRLREEAEQIVALFGDRLLPRLDQPAYSLSYANRRRVEIARALALRPRLLLLDEPTAGMNETETAEMQAIVAGLKAAGQTILLIEHKLDMVMRLSDRVIVMDDGRRDRRGRRTGERPRAQLDPRGGRRPISATGIVCRPTGPMTPGRRQLARHAQSAPMTVLALTASTPSMARCRCISV